MTIAENASKALVLYFSDTFIYSINTLHLKKGKKKTKNPEVTDMSGSFWKELRLAATLTGAGKSVQFSLILLFKGRKSSASNQLNNNKKRMIQVSLKLCQTGIQHQDCFGCHLPRNKWC